MSNNFFPLTAEELVKRINKIPKVWKVIGTGLSGKKNLNWANIPVKIISDTEIESFINILLSK